MTGFYMKCNTGLKCIKMTNYQNAGLPKHQAPLKNEAFKNILRNIVAQNFRDIFEVLQL